MKYTINELANSKGVSQPVREALLHMADYKQLYEQVCEQYDVLAKEFEAIKQARSAPVQQKPLFADVIAKHPGLAEELKAMDEAFELGYKAGLAAAHPSPVQSAEREEPVAWANPNDLKNFDMKVRTNGGPLHTLPLCLCTPPAAPVQEPVAHLWKHSQTGHTRVVMPGGIITADASWFVVGPLILGSTTPPAQPAPVQEPVAYLCENAVGHKYFRWKKPSSEFKPTALYTTPPAAQRQWVGLTDEERNKLWRDVVKWGDPSHDDVDLIKAIEAKLKEKNT
jgi:hypothetical protein